MYSLLNGEKWAPEMAAPCKAHGKPGIHEHADTEEPSADMHSPSGPDDKVPVKVEYSIAANSFSTSFLTATSVLIELGIVNSPPTRHPLR